MKKSGMKKEFQLHSDLSEVQNASAKVLAFLKPLRLGEGVLFDIRLCLEEALINAIKYGNEGRKDLKVRLAVEAEPREVRLSVEDQGRGFDSSKVNDCTRAENLGKAGGRGVFLMHQLMDRVKYNAKGNGVLMVKLLNKETRAPKQGK